MAPKMEIQKIDDKKRCQVIFSKRRAAFKKQAKEFSIWCDVDLAYVMISPCGRVHKFSTKTSIENVMHRYVNLPVDERLSQISNAEEMGEKLEKLRQLEHIEGDGEKLNHLEKQIENLEQEMQKRQKEKKCLEDDLRNYEPFLEKERFLHQLSWSERRVKQSWERVTLKKKAFLGSCSYSLTSSSDGQPSSDQVRTNRSSIPKIQSSQVGQRQPGLTEINYDVIDLTKIERLMQVSHNIENELVISCSSAQNPSSNHNQQLLMQLDPWISPYSSKLQESILDELSGEGKGKQIAYEATAAAGTSKFHIQGFPTMPSHQNSAQDALKALFPQSHIPRQAMNSDSNRPFAVAEPQLPSTLWQQGADFGQIAPLGVQQHPPLTFDNNMISPLGVQQHQPQTFDHNMDIIIGNNTSFGVDDVSLLSPPTLGQQGHGGMVQMNEFNFNQEQLNSFSGGNNNLFNSLEAHPLSNLDHRTEQNDQLQPPPHGIAFDNPPAPLTIDPPPPVHQNSSVGPVSEVNGLVANPSWTEAMQDAGIWEWEELHAQVGQGDHFP